MILILISMPSSAQIVISLALLFNIAGVQGATPTKEESPSHSALLQRYIDNHNAVLEKASGVKLGAQRVRRDLDTIPCFDARSKVSRPVVFEDSDATKVYRLLNGTVASDASKVFALVPDEFMWWVRSSQNVSIVSLATALHESSHALTRIATRCNAKQRVLYFRGANYPIESELSASPNYSIAASVLPEQFKSTNPMSRYHRYLVMSRSVSGNDFLVLLDEFGAHIEAAELELQLAGTLHYKALKDSGLTAMNGNVSGTVEFMQFTIAYLLAIKKDDAHTFNAIKDSILLQKHLKRLWSNAESVVCRSKPFSAQAGGLYHVPHEALKLVSSDWARTILDEMKIPYARSSDCLNFFWKSSS